MTYHYKKINITPKNHSAEQGDFSSLDNIETTAMGKSALEGSIIKGSSDFELSKELEDKITETFKNKAIYTNHQELDLISSKGEVLNDKKTDWRDLKLRSNAVARVLDNTNQAVRMFDCGSSLTFHLDKNKNYKLARAIFCKHRMCPACQKRRSLAVYHQLLLIGNALLKDHPKTRFILLTLTVPNVKYEELKDTFKHLSASFKRMTNTKRFKSAIWGFFRGEETTYNEKRDDYHPHYHILLAVKCTYFTRCNYISQAEWLEMWQKATRQHEITQVDCRAIKPNARRKTEALPSAISEVAKYSMKFGDFLKKLADGDYIANKKVINELSIAFKNKRFTAYGGILKEYYQKLNLQDIESHDADLVNVEPCEEFVAVAIQIFTWNYGINNYVST